MTHFMEKYLTPYKYGKPVIGPSGKDGTFDYLAVDCPFVFYHQDQWHMMYVGFDGTGYQTALSVSVNLLDWKFKGLILPRQNLQSGRWDAVGAAGTWILKTTNRLDDLPTLKKVDGKYWLIYHSYPNAGYEEGAAEIGLAWTEDDDLLDWHCLEQPIYSWRDGDDWEKGGLYKACLIEEAGQYHLYYNAKNETYGHWIEQIGHAVSPDLYQWKRDSGNPVVPVDSDPEGWCSHFRSDPGVYRDGDIWLMFFFGLGKRHAQDGIAWSDDLYSWKIYPDPIIRYGNPGELDEIHAHKPSAVRWNGVLYHFYCAVRKPQKGDIVEGIHNEFRCLTVATSEPLAEI